MRKGRIFYHRARHASRCCLLFVVSGLARAYCLGENGREFNWSFHFNDENVNPTNVFAIDYASYIAHQPSRLYIEALSIIDVLSIPRAALDALYEESHFWCNIARVIAERVYCVTHHRSLNQFSLAAGERYEQLMSMNPVLIEKNIRISIGSLFGDYTAVTESNKKRTLTYPM